MSKLLSEKAVDEMTPEQRARMLDHARYLADGERWRVPTPDEVMPERKVAVPRAIAPTVEVSTYFMNPEIVEVLREGRERLDALGEELLSRAERNLGDKIDAAFWESFATTPARVVTHVSADGSRLVVEADEP